MNLQRLLTMHPSELAFRCRQQAFKTIERLTAPDGDTTPVCQLDSTTTDVEWKRLRLLFACGDHGRASLLLLDRFRRQAPARFFAGCSDTALASSLATLDPQLRARVIEQADAVCRGEFDILGYGKLSFGSPIDWQSEPLAGLAIPHVHWSRIDPLLKSQVGDSKVVWELNRHQWLLDLGQAWRLTGDERYARAFVFLVSDWMRANPLGLGINWSSSLEVALRLIAWCWALVLFRDAAAMSPEFFVTILGWLQAHARYIERYLSHYFSPNTHLTGEALGLYYAGTLLAGLQGATEWRAQGRQILQQQLERQVFSDGVYFEQSTSYQYYTVEIYLHFLLLAARNNERVPLWMHERVGKMLDFLLAVRSPDNTMPLIGDSDGGWLVPLVRRAPVDHRGLFSTAAVLFSNPHLAWASGTLAAETLWLLGTSAGQGWSILRPQSPEPAKLVCFAEGGYVVMRNRWGQRAHQLIFDAGPLGCHVSGGHGHADLLSIQCSAFGEAYLVDAGTCCYTADTRWRNYFRSTRAHNTVMVDGRGQAEPKGPFSWHHRPAATLRLCAERPGYCEAGAEHEAYRDLADAVTHRRRVLFVDARYWVVVDDLVGTANHDIDLRFQFAPLAVAAEADGWIRASGRQSALLVRSFAAVPLAATIRCGELQPIAGWISPNYGQRVAAPVLSYCTNSRLPLRIVTLLYPVSDVAGSAPVVSVQWEHGEIVGLTIGTDNREIIRIANDTLAVLMRIREWHT